MNGSPVRICIVGAGAIGTHLAARALAGGADVSMVARGVTLDGLRAGGLQVKTIGVVLNGRPQVSEDPGELGRQDAVIIAVKANSLSGLEATLRRFAGLTKSFVFIGNGIPWWYGAVGPDRMTSRFSDELDPGGRLAAATDGAIVAGGVFWSACTVERPGVVRVTSSNDRLVFGWPGDPDNEVLRQVAEVFACGGISARVAPDILDVIWTKLTGNVISGILSILTRSAPSAYMREPECGEISRRIASEMALVAQAASCRSCFDVEEFLRSAAVLDHKPSILQDVERCASAETHAQFLMPLQIGEFLGVDMPMLKALVPLAVLSASGATG